MLELSDHERDQLRRWARRRSSAQALALRSRIVLGCADGLDNKQVATRERVSQQTVGKWRARFVEFRLDGLTDDPRPGRPPSISAEQVEDVVVATLEATPTNAVPLYTIGELVTNDSCVASICVFQTGAPVFLFTAKTRAGCGGGPPKAAMDLPIRFPRISKLPATAAVPRAESFALPV